MQVNEQLTTTHSKATGIKATILRFEYTHWSVFKNYHATIHIPINRSFLSSGIKMIYDSTLLKMTPAG